MKFKALGNTGVMVSNLCFGTMSFGGDADRDMSKAMFKRCREAGINFFDCANGYSQGLAEEILGECIAGSRHELVITTKAYFPTSPDINARGASRKHLLKAVEDSLRRLKTDFVDILFIHRFDERTPLEETLRTLDDLVRQGKILYPGASNFAAWQVEKALGISERKNLARFECMQPMYNLVKRQAEVEILPMAQAEQIGVIPYSPLGGGLLTGKYGKDRKSAQGRLTANPMYTARYSEQWVFDAAVNFSKLARKLGYEPATLAIAWVSSHPAVTAPIIGARSTDQLSASLAAADVELDPEIRAEISALTPEPPPATDRSEERAEQAHGPR